MNVKSYRGKTADECMKKLKSDLGSDAVILQSRTVKPILGRFGRSMHEIVAADDTGAVLDKFAEKAGDRRTVADTSRATAAPAEAQPRLTLSRGIIGNTALAPQAQPPLARRERLTLEEAAQLHEQGAYDRLVAAGVLNSQTTATSSSTSSTRSTPAQERGDASSRDMQLVYSNTVERNTADQVGSAPVADKPQSDERISRLEKQIALLTSALQKQAAPQATATATPVAAPGATTAAVVTRQNSVVSKPVAPVGEFEGSPVVAQKLSREAEAVTTPQARLSTAMQPDVDTDSAISTNTSDSSTDDALQAEASATAQTSSPSLGGFLRYRLPAQDAEKAPKAAAETKPAAPTRGNGTRAKQAASLPPMSEQHAAPSLAPDGSVEALPVNAALPYLKALRASQVAEPLLRRISAELPPDLSPADARDTVHDLLTQRMLIGGGITVPTNGKIMLAALLGPTGVGKTTTIAKLAANLTMNGNCRVAMVTLDTSRVAAAEQLKGYGDAMNIPVHVAYDRGELEAVLMQLARDKTQVVLIDTPGRGPQETLSLAEMSQSLRSIVDLHSYVVVPAPLSGSNFENTIQRFIKISKPNAIILTKMDETADNHCLGFLLNAQAKYHLPLAYVTMGGRVPDDILVADAHLLVNKLMTSVL